LRRFEDRLRDAGGPGEHVSVPEAQNAETLTPQETIAMQIVRDLINVLTTIQLDDDGRFQADEIADISADGMLSSEFETT
jgi:hypothetical protein